MDITRETLAAMYVAFKKNFQVGFDRPAASWNKVATLVPSNTAQNFYDWLGSFPGMREWIGDRQIKFAGEYDYAIKNRKFEQTIGVPIDKIEDDLLGMYAPMFESMGEAASLWPDEIVWEAIRNAFVTNCYDGQFFFDTDHPTYNADGDQNGTVSNTQGGAGAPWMLLNTKKTLKPFIWQLRQAPSRLIKLDREEDQNVFFKDQYIYGTKGRGNSGYGFWQMAHGSKQTLNAANFRLARQAMEAIKDDRGRPVVNSPNLLVVGPALRDTAEELIKKERLTGGEDNVLKDAVEVMVSPYLY